MDAASHPLTLSIGPILFQNHDAQFTRGLEMILNGFEPPAARRKKPDRAPRS